MANDFIVSAVVAVVVAAASIGTTIGLLFEFGRIDLKTRWKRFIGLSDDAASPGHPRLWALGIGTAWLVLGESAVLADLLDEIRTGDVPLPLEIPITGSLSQRKIVCRRE